MRYLITAIGSFSADCVIKSLKRENGYVVGCDIYDKYWHAEALVCDAFYKAPYATKEKKYIDFLLSVIDKERISHLIPLTDLEIDVINAHRDTFTKSNVKLCIQSEECLSIARDKFALYNSFKDDGIVNMPTTVHSKNLDKNGAYKFPLIAKPVNGRSSEGLCRVYSKEELQPFFYKDNYILQEMIEGPIFTVDYVRDSFGNDVSIPREELLRTKNGAGTTVRVKPDPMLSKTVSHIGNSLGIIGCVNMEFIYNSDKYYLIDINPRFSAGVAFSNFIGYDMVKNNIRCFTGSAIDKAAPYKEQILTKRYSEELLWVKN